ncbi:valine--tRNA ligase [Oscillospiraceae bacterium 21-37]|uniref:valine--tRNA ligase n=1 Tax=unclassified Neglectibacter TaxID=2632164 RepID=UPI001371A8B8|nr:MULTISPECIES: valine--tRNA ligase [unclassified Neglectibacter]NBI17367.1 valine--tRNA ligase [Neglectibacter sp. 59]NBJ72746.1 valine--tRNA ligase [Neglectibacter sp. X4]NCE80629.1 valine--tRNA ligase [Neglectibacter sp. X58]
MSCDLAKAYEPKEVERRIYDFWMQGGYFHAEADPQKKPYTIVMPPPNITGQLHVGHAMDTTMPDILIRWRRMQGYSALWLPGTDHASIATEAKIVDVMKEEGVTKEDLGREKFLERAWAWREKYGSRIVEQQKLLGLSCDWERSRFTMDEGLSKAVRHVFVKLYEKGLIYRGERMINWCPHCQTALSDIEVVFEEQNGSFWHLRYPLADGSGYVELATTRPETMLGDTAVAVHPEDERYKHLIGKNVILPLVDKEIPIVADEYVEMDFGTGVVKITPAHDPNDFEVGKRHDLPIINVMNEDGSINENGGKYAGMAGMDARRQIVKDLEEGGFLIKVEPLTHNVGTCQRCHTVAEPRISTQWFVKMEPLAKPAIDAVRSGKIQFIPEDRATKVYYNWMENIKDWCISRQLWWGHRIPAWYCEDCGGTIVSETDPDTCPKCGGKRLKQDEDTLDTWFSSALWPFSTLGWPEKTEDLKYFYPTDVLMPGFDIIFFWVARMIFSGLEHTGDIPFKKVCFHGLVRDAQGRKMSKSLGNGVDPVKVIDEYGADALRLFLITGNTPGNDMRFSTDKVAASRNFANKIWNAARFIHMNIDGKDVPCALPETLTLADKWIVSRFNTVAKEVTENLEKFEIGIAVQKIYDFLWDEFCDWTIELAKLPMSGTDEEAAQSARQVLVWVLGSTLKLLHPFMPFITEEIWQSLPHEGEALIVAPWPVYDEALHFPEAEKEMEKVKELITAVRTRRSEMNVPPSRKAHLYIETQSPAAFETEKEAIARLAYCSGVEIGESFAAMEGAVTVVTAACRGYLPMDDLIDRAAETARLTKELESAQKQLDTVNAKLQNETFMSKAPQKVIDGVKQNGEKLREKVRMIEESLAAFR